MNEERTGKCLWQVLRLWFICIRIVHLPDNILFFFWLGYSVIVYMIHSEFMLWLRYVVVFWRGYTSFLRSLCNSVFFYWLSYYHFVFWFGYSAFVYWPGYHVLLSVHLLTWLFCIFILTLLIFSGMVYFMMNINTFS